MLHQAEIEQAASIYNIPILWIAGIIAQESNWDRYAIRYEPSYSYLYNVNDIAIITGTTINTEIQCQKMSWGLCQIMGALAREQQLKGGMGQLFEIQMNINHLCIRLKRLKELSPLEDDVFAMYNGGPGEMHTKKDGKYLNQSYVNGVKGNIEKLK